MAVYFKMGCICWSELQLKYKYSTLVINTKFSIYVNWLTKGKSSEVWFTFQAQRTEFSFTIWEPIKLLYYMSCKSIRIHESWLYNFDPQVIFLVEFCNTVFSCFISWSFLKGCTFNFQLWIKNGKTRQKNRRLSWLSKCKAVHVMVIWSLSDQLKEILRLGRPEICKLLPKFGVVLYSLSLKLPHPLKWVNSMYMW